MNSLIDDATLFEADQPIPEVPNWLCEAQHAADAARPARRGRLRAVGNDERAQADPRQVIRLEPGELHNYAARAERAVAEVVYTQGRTQMVRLGRAYELPQPEAEAEGKEGEEGKKRKVIVRDPVQPVVLHASCEWLRRRLSEQIRCERFDARAEDWRTVDVPRALARHIADQQDWPAWRELAGIASAPFLRADLTVSDKPGYDPVSRVCLLPTGAFPAIPDRPSKDEARAALARLLEPFSEFPFASPAARSAFVAHILTAAARHALDVRPIFHYTAPLKGTGKTLLARMPSLIVDGVLPATKPWADKDEPELRKTLLAGLLAGDATLLFDNVQTGAKVRSAVLCNFSTTELYSDRILGGNESPKIENRCIVVLTGNNITPAGDLARRSLVVRQDAGVEKVEGRRFRIPDLKTYVIEHRGELVAAVLTILRAYSLAEDKMKVLPVPTYERWSQVCRDPLIWLGMADPCGTQDDEADDDTEGLGEALEAIRERMGEGEWTAAELEAAGGEVMMGEPTARSRKLAAALVAGRCRELRKVMYWLREYRDRMAGGLKLVQAGQHAHAARWQIHKA